MIRIPDSVSISEKLDRVHVLLNEVGLENVGSNKIGGITFTGISGGQRRRLSIAIELLRLPQLLLLDEPTSGLDSTSALKLIKLLSELAHKNRVVLTTIHQPRAEIIDLFDDIVLLGDGGHIIYFGPAKNAVQHLKEAGIAQDPAAYDNPGDFIIDAIGLDPEAEESSASSGGGTANNVDLSGFWRRSALNQKLVASIKQSLRQSADEPLMKAPTNTTSSVLTQTWVIFARRLARLYDTPAKYLPNYFTILVVSVVVGIAFSYKDPVSLETDAYETMMFLFVMCTYAMLVQYINATPVYYTERPQLKASRAANACSIAAYIMACMIEETMAAIMQVCLVGIASMFEADLNDDPNFAWFSFSLVVMGVCAFQAEIMLISMMSDDLAVACGFTHHRTTACPGSAARFLPSALAGFCARASARWQPANVGNRQCCFCCCCCCWWWRWRRRRWVATL